MDGTEFLQICSFGLILGIAAVYLHLQLREKTFVNMFYVRMDKASGKNINASDKSVFYRQSRLRLLLYIEFEHLKDQLNQTMTF